MEVGVGGGEGEGAGAGIGGHEWYVWWVVCGVEWGGWTAGQWWGGRNRFRFSTLEESYQNK